MVAFVLLASVGCQSPGVPVGAFGLAPAVGGQDTTVAVSLTAAGDEPAFSIDSRLDLGPGVSVRAFDVADGFEATAELIIAEDAALGARDAVVSTGAATTVQGGAFLVIAESFTVAPDHASPGQVLDVTFTGRATDWQTGWPSFGDGVDVLDFVLSSPTSGVARVAVHPQAGRGARDVQMGDGAAVLTRYDGFRVEGDVISAEFSPGVVWQGDIVSFTIRGINTDFQSGAQLEFWYGGSRRPDIEPLLHSVDANGDIQGQMHVSNAAHAGARDVRVISGDGEVVLLDGLEVEEAVPDLAAAAVITSFDVARDDGATSVTASAYFYVPLDISCGGSRPPADGPRPYDQAGVYPDPPEAVSDCPTPKTVSAGDYVWFEGPHNVVTLAKHERDGVISYVGDGLDLDDYQFGTLYALHTQGDPDGIPELLIPAVQPTVPSDYTLLTPLESDVVRRDREAPFTWTPANTYPDATFNARIRGTLTAIAGPGYAGVIPWDDGEFRFGTDELLQLDAGAALFQTSSTVHGPKFGLPFSTNQSCRSSSYVTATVPIDLQ